MNTSTNKSGTFRHRQILQTMTEFYEKDERVLAILLFGSLSRGNWDPYSDIDIDIVMTDNSFIDARLELNKLCEAIKQKHGLVALIMADVEEGDVVLDNLLQFSVRYHILSETKPAILDTMCSLSGSLSLDEIRAAANYAYESEPIEGVDLVNQAIRFTLELHNAMRRQRIWMAMEMVHRIRASLMLLYARSHDAIRPIHLFDAQAGPECHEWLRRLSPQADLKALEAAFSATLELLKNHLAEFSEGLYRLTTNQKHILSRLKDLQSERNSVKD